jgi:hypothetical protein
LACDPGNPGLTLAWVSKVIGTKHEKYLMLIFNSKAKILIKNQFEQSPEKKMKVTSVFFFQNKWKIP